MSSINPYFTMSYSQPGAYRFSHDSVFLARRVFELAGESILAQSRILDLCAGCGIVGFDLLFHLRKERGIEPEVCDFLEVQKEYAAHFEINRSRLKPSRTRCRFLNFNYEALSASDYDLIVCNPPYFRPGQGALSNSRFKNRCRFFLDADFNSLWRSLARALVPGGRAYVLLRDLSEHRIDAFAEAQAAVARNMDLRIIGEIRGTALVEGVKR